MHTQHEGIQESLSSAKSRLDKLYSDVSQTMDKIKSREKFLNNQLDPILVEYRAVQVRITCRSFQNFVYIISFLTFLYALEKDELARVSDQYQEVNGGVTERQRALALVTEELDAVKQEMEERGSSMTDGSKLRLNLTNVY